MVNDDGLAYMTEEEQQERIRFYRENHISWVARPKNNSECGYIRKGRFKKASNMNFALNVANKVEDALFRMLEGNSDKPILIDRVEEEAYYNQALSQVLESDSRIKAGGDIRIGEHILIVDSDTRVVRLRFFLYSLRLNLTYSSSPRIAYSTARRKCSSARKSLFSNTRPA